MVDIATREMLVFFVEWGQTEKKGSLIDRENVLSSCLPLFDLLIALLGKIKYLY